QTPLPRHVAAAPPRAATAPAVAAPAAAAPPAAVSGGQLAQRTTLDSAGPGTAAPMTRSQPQSAPPAAPPPSEPARPRPSEQSVIVNEDAIGGGAPAAVPASAMLGGQRYLASTIYFAHGSASLTEAERREIADIARA